jgi:hypothetical protein
MKKLYQKLFGSENPAIAVAFMCLTYLAAHFFIKMAFNVQDAPSFNGTYFTIDAPTSVIYELEKVAWLQWLTLIIGIGVYVGYVLKNAGLGKGEGDKTPGYMFLLGALIVISGFFPAIFAQNKEEYRKQVDEPTFEYYKTNPDKAAELWNLKAN